MVTFGNRRLIRATDIVSVEDSANINARPPFVSAIYAGRIINETTRPNTSIT